MVFQDSDDKKDTVNDVVQSNDDALQLNIST